MLAALVVFVLVLVEAVRVVVGAVRVVGTVVCGDDVVVMVAVVGFELDVEVGGESDAVGMFVVVGL